MTVFMLLTKDGYALLETGKHKFELEYFQKVQGAVLSLEVISPDGKKRPIPIDWYYHK